MSSIIIEVTHPSKPEAVRITTDLLNKRLIACATYFPIESVYWWGGRLTKSDEIMTHYKTRSEYWEVVKSHIEAMHKYDTPAIIRFATVEATEKYEAWIHAETESSEKIFPS